MCMPLPSLPPAGSPLRFQYGETAHRCTTPGYGFLCPIRCRTEVPRPVLIARDPVLEKLGVTRPGEWSFYCQCCRFRFSADCDATEWPPCLICGLNFSLVASGHLPYAQAAELGVCRLCKQASATDANCCSLCGSLISMVKKPSDAILVRKAAMDALYRKPQVPEAVEVVIVPNEQIQ